jgi:hypothetical protein
MTVGNLNYIIFFLATSRSCCQSITTNKSCISSVCISILIETLIDFLFRHSLHQERAKNLLLNKKLLDHYLLTNSLDLQQLPIYSNDMNNSNIQFQQGFLSPTQSILVPQQQNLSTPNEHSRISLVNTPGNQSILSPVHCGSLAMKQQVKLAGSHMFRHYSSII